MIPVAQDTHANNAEINLQLKATESEYDTASPFRIFKLFNTRIK